MTVARFLLAIRSKWLSTSVAHLIEVNGQPGICYSVDSDIHSVITLEIVDGSIRSIYSMRNPNKLKRAQPAVLPRLIMSERLLDKEMQIEQTEVLISTPDGQMPPKGKSHYFSILYAFGIMLINCRNCLLR